MVFSFMARSASTRQDINQTANNAGMVLSTPGLDKRFNAKAAYFLDSLLAEAVGQMVCADARSASILSRFNGVYISDSTLVSLPDELVDAFQGHNGDDDAAAKVAVQWDLNSGHIGLWLSAGRVHDQRTGSVTASLPPGALRLNDLGYFNLATFAQDAAEGRYFFSRYKVGTLVHTGDGQSLDLLKYLRQRRGDIVDMPIQLGKDQLPCRLIALPVPPEQVGKRRKQLQKKAKKRGQAVSQQSLDLASWTIYITNIPAEQLAGHEAAILGGTRWQIERLFKLWKSDGQLAASRSQDAHRVLCEFYAKLLACLVQHWVILVGCWQRLDRSLHQATQVIRKRAFCLLDAINDINALTGALERTAQVMYATCGLSKRAGHRLTYQDWIDAAHV
jgi:hypothetical protein